MCYTGIPAALGERLLARQRLCLRHREAKNHDAAKVGTDNSGAITDSRAAGPLALDSLGTVGNAEQKGRDRCARIDTLVASS